MHSLRSNSHCYCFIIISNVIDLLWLLPDCVSTILILHVFEGEVITTVLFTSLLTTAIALTTVSRMNVRLSAHLCFNFRAMQSIKGFPTCTSNKQEANTGQPPLCGTIVYYCIYEICSQGLLTNLFSHFLQVILISAARHI